MDAAKCRMQTDAGQEHTTLYVNKSGCSFVVRVQLVMRILHQRNMLYLHLEWMRTKMA